MTSAGVYRKLPIEMLTAHIFCIAQTQNYIQMAIIYIDYYSYRIITTQVSYIGLALSLFCLVLFAPLLCVLPGLALYEGQPSWIGCQHMLERDEMSSVRKRAQIGLSE